MRTTRASRRRRQRGTQIAEFALVLPVLAFLALAVSEGANFIRAHQILNNAAREAARAASAAENVSGWSGGTTNAVAVQAACNYLRNNSAAFTGWDAVQDPTCSSAAFTITVERTPIASAPKINGVAMSMTNATVTYRYPLQFLPSLPNVGLPNPLPLTGTAQFRMF